MGTTRDPLLSASRKRRSVAASCLTSAATHSFPRARRLFPERTLAQFLSRQGENVNVYTFEKLGVAPIREGLRIWWTCSAWTRSSWWTAVLTFSCAAMKLASAHRQKTWQAWLPLQLFPCRRGSLLVLVSESIATTVFVMPIV